MMGSTLALLLAQALPSKTICLLDKHPFERVSKGELALPSFDARTTALAPTTVELMRNLGVWGDMQPHATAIKYVQVSDKGHSGWVRLNEQDNAGQPLGFVVENRAIGQALVSAVSEHVGIEVCSGVEVEKLQSLANGVNVSLSDGYQVKAELVLIADGANSNIGQNLGIQQTIKDYGQSAIVASVEYDKAHNGTAFERFTDCGPMALLPAAGNAGRSSALVWTWPKAQVEHIMGLDDTAFLGELQQRFGYRLGNFTKVSPRANYPLKLCLATEQVRSNLVVMGNAAHFLHPVAGQGFNLAARDGLRLAQTLASAPESLGDLSTLMAYQKAQSSDQLRTIMLSHGFNELFGSDRLPLIGLRNLGMMAIENCSLIRSVFIRQMSGRASPRVSFP